MGNLSECACACVCVSNNNTHDNTHDDTALKATLQHKSQQNRIVMQAAVGPSDTRRE